MPLARLALAAGPSSAGGNGSTGVTGFLSGLSLVCKLQADRAAGIEPPGGGSGSREATVAEASGCFLRAVAGLSAGTRLPQED